MLACFPVVLCPALRGYRQSWEVIESFHELTFLLSLPHLEEAAEDASNHRDKEASYYYYL